MKAQSGKPPKLLILLILQLFCGCFVDASSLRRALQPESNEPAIALTNGNATEVLHFSAEADTKLFVLDDIHIGDTVACVTDADEGDIDLFLHFNTPPVADPDGQAGVHTCDSFEYTSEEYCVVTATDQGQHSVYVLLRAYTATQNATLTCTKTPLTSLTRGVPLVLQSVAWDHDALFQMELEAGESVECIASGNSDLDLYLHLGGIPSPRDLMYDCHSAGSNNQTEYCALQATPHHTTLFVLIDAWSRDVENVELSCTTVQAIELEQEYSVIAIEPLERRVYRIDHVKEATSIACSAKAPSGVLDVYMFVDKQHTSASRCSRDSSGQEQLCLVDVPENRTVFVHLNGHEVAEEVQFLCVAVQEMLTPGIAISELDLLEEPFLGSFYFAMPVEKGDWVTCSSTTESRIDVGLRMGHNRIPLDSRYDCHDDNNGAACGFMAQDDGFAIVAMDWGSRLDNAESAALQCWASKGLSPGKTETLASGLAATEKRLFVLPNVKEGMSVDCLASKSPESDGDFSMFLRFDAIPDNGQKLYNCSSSEQIQNFPHERACIFLDAPSDGSLYIALQNLDWNVDVEEVKLTCYFIEGLSDGTVSVAKDHFDASP